jgi:hypothetical protein
MNKPGPAAEKDSKCLLIINRGSNYKAVNEHVKALNGFYNGVGWYVEYKHKDAVAQLCQQANLQCIDLPLLDESFDGLRRRHKASYYHEKSIKTHFEIANLKKVLKIPEGIDIDELQNDEHRKGLEQIPEGRRLLELTHEYDVLHKRIKQAEEEENISKLSLTGAFKYLLEPASEDKITEEIRNISPGVYVGYNIGDVDLKIPGGAVSIIAGPTSHGKTATLINFALGALSDPRQNDSSVYFFSYEESRAAIVSLFLNTYINEPLSKNNRESIKSYFRDGDMRYFASEGMARQLFPPKKNEFFETLIENGRLNVFYSELSAQELVAAIHYLKKNSNAGLVCVDYMQLLKFGSGNFGSRQEELKQICLMLKDCAVETGLPILLAAQFNRTVVAEADISPTAISEAGDIERVANLMLGFWNRNFEGFSRHGNVDKKGRKIAKEPTIYMEIMKGRAIGAGHSEIFEFDGNTGKISNRLKGSQKPTVEF